jgi:hypothetical protein
MLTMTSRLVYVKHILCSVPVYNLMVLDYTQTGFRKLESLSRKFLWGSIEDGGAKLSLVAWDRLIQPKLAGGLEFFSFESQGQLLKLRNISKPLEFYDSKWVWFTEKVIRKGLRTRPLKQILRDWTPVEFLLLMPKIKCSSKTVKAIVKSWLTVHGKLTLKPAISTIPHSLLFPKLFYLSRLGATSPTQEELKALMNWTGTRSLSTVGDLVTPDGTWLAHFDVDNRVRSSREVGRECFDKIFNFLISFKGQSQ